MRDELRMSDIMWPLKGDTPALYMMEGTISTLNLRGKELKNIKYNSA